MKYFIVLILALITYSCECPMCDAIPPTFRFSFFNTQGDNLLDPQLPNGLKISSFEYENGKQIDFLVKDYVIKGHPEGIYHLELRYNRRDSFLYNCLKKETTFYLKFDNQDIDTLSIKIDEIEDGECCSYYHTNIKYNGILLNKADTIVGALIVIK